MKFYPVDTILPQVKEALSVCSSAVLQAPPGAGKTTRVPLALLDGIPPEKGRIVMLEPRRLAAVSAARWMAQSLGEQAGETVGYSIRFDSRVSPRTRIEVVTEGILTRRIQTDPGLSGIAMVIFDEFHERSLHADLALSLCLDIRRGIREDLRILVMSATLDSGPVAALLDNAPVILSEGQVFPVEERYLDDRSGRPLTDRVVDAVLDAAREAASGDMLIFLPGAGEIRACCDALRPVLERRGDKITLHPLYGDLPFEEQQRAILPGKDRKIVVATNVAETSLTIEGVSIVIDSGLTRRLRHDPSTGMNRLVTMNVSRESAIQRKGRAGRLGPGVCYRLYSRHAFRSMIPAAPPEILTADLSQLCLELAAWGVKDPSMLSWLDAPPRASWEAAISLLRDLGALDATGAVTQTGRAMARFPLHPRLGRMMLRAEELGCTGLGADLAALLSERDILRRTAPGHAHEVGTDVADRVEILRLWRKTGEVSPGPDRWALRAVDRTSRQLRELSGAKKGDRPADKDNPDMIPRLLLSAFPDRIAGQRQEGRGHFVLSKGRGVRLLTKSSIAGNTYLIAVNMDAGEKAEGVVHVAAPLTEDLIRSECSDRIRTVRRVEWDRRAARVIATTEERLGSIVLSTRPFNPSDEESAPLILEAIRSTPDGLVRISEETLQLMGRVSFVKRLFPEEAWPDLSRERLMTRPEEWITPWLTGLRTAEDVKALDLLPALRSCLTRIQRRLLDERAPVAIVVPSGRRAVIDYAEGDIPVLSVKVQELFGLADTPVVAEGRAAILVHLLSPAGRPVQITQDLRGFWNTGYQLVKRELKGRYPKHPWPDDPWNAVPTGRTKQPGRRAGR